MEAFGSFKPLASCQISSDCSYFDFYQSEETDWYQDYA